MGGSRQISGGLQMRVEIKKTLMGKYVAVYNCPGCQEKLRSPANEIGQQDVCPTCQTQFTVPGMQELKRLLEKKHADAERVALEVAERKALKEAERQAKAKKRADEASSRRQQTASGRDEDSSLSELWIPAPAPVPQRPALSAGVRLCPYCSEEIQATAVKCKHCGEFLDDSKKKQGKAIFKASSEFIGLLCSYHIMDANKNILRKLKPGESFEVPIHKDTVMFVKYAGGFGGPKQVECYAHQANKFSVTLSQSGLGCVVARVDVIDSDA
jgi:predicted amidophosphoribosyltransferase